jgi:Zn-dependent protease with chaperone function
MPITLKCRCATRFDVPDSFAGKSSMCPGCGTFLDISDYGKQIDPPDEPKANREVAADEYPPRELKRMIRDALDGEIRPVRRTVGYRFAVLCTAAAMVALPVLYVGLIVVIAVLVYWHATTNYTVFRTYRVFPALIAYVGPIIVGIVAIAFMLKPLLARPGRARRGRLVKLDKEPVLATFVDKIAMAVHAPRPRRIEVNCEVNAFAGYGRGLLGVFGRNLTLTIGLPLVEGLNACQLAGVIAHEFGHFSQGAAMRLSFLVRSINAWFHRVVTERDSWDDALADWCQMDESPGPGYQFRFAFAVIGWMAQACVFVTRAVLWVFMMMSNALSCFLLRRMEYDADRSEARLVGVQTFDKTSRRLAVLTVAEDEAIEIVEDCWHKDRFPDDFAALVVGLAISMSDRERAEVLEELKDARTGPFDSHPCYSDRLANVRRDDPSGVFRIDLPAGALFRELPKLAEAASLDHYKAMFGGGLQATLRPTKNFLKMRA